MRVRVHVDLLYWIIFLVPIPFILWPIFLGGTEVLGLLVGITSLYGLFVLWLTFGSYYALEEEYLRIKVMFIRQKIRYENIKSIRLTRNLLSSMAFSMNRIEIKEKSKGMLRGTTYISPQDREGFYEALKARIPSLQEKKVILDDFESF